MFSIPPCWPSGPDMPAARIRPTVSDALPAANGTTMLSGRDGQSSARAVNDDAVKADAAASRMPRKRAGIFSSLIGRHDPANGRLLNQGVMSKNHARSRVYAVPLGRTRPAQTQGVRGPPI